MRRMLEKIIEIEPGALKQKPIWLPDLRVKMMDLQDTAFKDMLLELVKAKIVFMQKHAHPAQATEVERRLMVDVDGDLICAIAIKESEADRVRKMLSAKEHKKKIPVPSCETSVQDISQKKRNAHGGARDGSGRQYIKIKDKRVCLGFARVPGWIADWLKAEGNSGQKIEKALLEYYCLSPP